MAELSVDTVAEKLTAALGASPAGVGQRQFDDVSGR
jgi:hypothetical protein